MRRLSLAVPLCLALFGSGCGKSGGGNRITAGGATFIDPLMQKWMTEYKAAKGVEIDYTAKGSGYGISQVTGKSVAFGCSDAPMNKKELDAAAAAGGEIIHVPLTVGAVAVIYNLPGVPELKLSGPVLADIYMRKVTKWNEKPIADLNPGVALPDTPIVPVFRAEDSGTTATFTEYLAKVSDPFKTDVGVSKKPKWPAGGTGQQGSGGVAQHVKDNEGSIGYVEVSYALKSQVATAALKNKAGGFAKPDTAAVTAAADGASGEKPTSEPHSLHPLGISLTDAGGEKAYPIVGISYGMIFLNPPAAPGGAAAAEFLKWAVTDGQQYAADLGYAPLPKTLQAKCTELLNKVSAQ